MASRNRRGVLRAIGCAIAVGSAGCTGGTQENSPADTQATSTEASGIQTTASQDETPTTLTPSQRLLPETDEMGSFGRSVSVSGEFLAVGASGRERDTQRLTNAVSIYQQNGSNWQSVEQFPRSKDVPGFGSSVVINENRLLIGAADNSDKPESHTTSLLERKGSSWQRTTELEPFESSSNLGYGEFAAFDGKTALVAAYRDTVDDNQYRGSVYAFTDTGSGWQQRQKLVPRHDGWDDERDLFGRSVAVSGDTAVIGAMLDRTSDRGNTGAAYVFERQGSDWTQTAVLTPESLETERHFGASVAIGSKHLLVGAPWADSTTGSVFAYRRSSSGWTQTDRFVPNIVGRYGKFGFSMDLHGSKLLVGAYEDGAGSAHLFVYREEGWQQIGKLIPKSANDRAWFGNSVSLSSNTAVVGARTQETPTGAGAVHIFDLNDEIE